MAAPRMQPSGFFEVVSSARMDGKLELFGFGQDDRAINPGDLVIVTTQYLKDGFKNQEIQASLKLRGRDMWLFVQAAQQALELWESNKDYLQAPASRPADPSLDPRSPMKALNNWQQAVMRSI
jgi:hypothetical protein